MDRFDIAIIGTGPAGLEAAITAKIRNKSVLLLGSKNLSDKIQKAHTIKNYLGIPNVPGSDLCQHFAEHLNEMDIDITEDRVNTIYAMGDYFAIQGHGDNYEASSVILACGLFTAKPFPGEMENLGRGVSYCATCDASLYRGKETLVLAYSKKEEDEAAFLAELASKVTYIAMYQDCWKSHDNITVLEEQDPISIETSEQGIKLNLKNEAITTDGIFILRDNVAPSQLVPGLALDGNHVKVDRSLRTNLPGMFACGDVTGAPYQYIKAAGEGNVAALSAVDYLAKTAKE